MRWRRLRPDELDHEVLWLSVTVGAALIGVGWIYFNMPTPPCVWHEITGFACPSCGATRSARALVTGDVSRAIFFNPLFFVTMVGTVFYDIYAAWVIFSGRPRLRFENVPRWLGAGTRFGIPILILINWAWLILNGI